MSGKAKHPYNDQCYCENCVEQAIQRMVVCGMIEKVGRGKYRMTPAGKAWAAIAKREERNND